MKPIFDCRTNHLGWLKDGMVFDLDICWIAFIHDGHLFAAGSCSWLGPYREGSLMDRGGRVVAWLEGTRPAALSPPLTPTQPPWPKRPFRPVRPLPPKRPLFPQATPSDWSALAWTEWLAIGAPPGSDGPPENDAIEES